MKIIIHKNFFEEVFVVISLLLFTDALISLVREELGFKLDASSGDGIMQVLLFGIYGITFFFIRWQKVVWAVTKEKLAFVLVTFALSSVVWSVAPPVTLRRSIALVGTTIFGTYLATRYSLKDQLRLLAWALGIACLLSLVFAVALPKYGVHQIGTHVGAWRGIYTHKNAMGRALSLSFMVFLLLALEGGRHRLVKWASLGLTVALIRMSTSATPLLSSLTLVSFLPLYWVLQLRHPLSAPLFAMGVMAGTTITTWFFGNVEAILGAAGRDLTFSGRTELWSVLLDMINKHPWLGYGYSAFWLGEKGESGKVWNIIGWQPTYAHNGYLQLGLDLGWGGIWIFALGFFINLMRALTRAHTNKTASGLLPLTYLTLMLPYNISDSVILQQNNIFWVLYVAMSLSLVVQHQESPQMSASAKLAAKEKG
ncbi:O-antigen ligase family protein [Coleofasciculus sp. H7-2]|uniref:O-antigen ligase family protein n=1 Tax=Coleofasciculus sp. H7-2 TaxID=3351545 RepID=UPI003671E197